MNVNKKLGRFKQWAGERMGQETKTGVSNDFKSLEVEMGLRQEGRALTCTSQLRKLTDCRHGTLTKINDDLCEDAFQA